MERESRRKSRESRSRSPSKSRNSEKRSSKATGSISGQEKRGSRVSKTSVGGGSRKGSLSSKTAGGEKKTGTDLNNEGDTQLDGGDGVAKQSLTKKGSTATISSVQSETTKKSLSKGGSQISKGSIQGSKSVKATKSFSVKEQSSGSQIADLTLDEVIANINTDNAGKDMPPDPGPCNAAKNPSQNAKCDADICVRLRAEYLTKTESETDTIEEYESQPKQSQVKSIRISASQTEEQDVRGSKIDDKRASQISKQSQILKPKRSQVQEPKQSQILKSKRSQVQEPKQSQIQEEQGEKNGYQEGFDNEGQKQGSQIQGSQSQMPQNQRPLSRGASLEPPCQIPPCQSGEGTVPQGSQMQVPGGLEGPYRGVPVDPDTDIPPDFYYGYYRPSPCSTGNFCTDGRNVRPVWNEPTFPLVTHPFSSCGPPRRIIIPIAYEMLPMPFPSQDEETQTTDLPDPAGQLYPSQREEKCNYPPDQRPPQNVNPMSGEPRCKGQPRYAQGQQPQGQYPTPKLPPQCQNPTQGRSFQGQYPPSQRSQSQGQYPSFQRQPSQGQYSYSQRTHSQGEYSSSQRQPSQGEYYSNQRQASQGQYSSSQRQPMQGQYPSGQRLPAQSQYAPGQASQGQYSSSQRQPTQGQPSGQYPPNQRPHSQGQYLPNQVQKPSVHGIYTSDQILKQKSKTNIPYENQSANEQYLPGQDRISQNRPHIAGKQFPSLSRSQHQYLSLGEPTQEEYIIRNIQDRPDESTKQCEGCLSKGQPWQNKYQLYGEPIEEVKYSSDEGVLPQKGSYSHCEKPPQEGKYPLGIEHPSQQRRPPSAQEQLRQQTESLSQQARPFLPGQSPDIRLYSSQLGRAPQKDRFSAAMYKSLSKSRFFPPNFQPPKDLTHLYLATPDFGMLEKKRSTSKREKKQLWDTDDSREDDNENPPPDTNERPPSRQSSQPSSGHLPEPLPEPPEPPNPPQLPQPTPPNEGQMTPLNAIASCHGAGGICPSVKSLMENASGTLFGQGPDERSRPPSRREDQGTQTPPRSRQHSPTRALSPNAKRRCQDLGAIQERSKDGYPFPPQSTQFAFTGYVGQEDSERRACLRPSCGRGANMPPCPSGSWRGNACLQGLQAGGLVDYVSRKTKQSWASTSKKTVESPAASIMLQEDTMIEADANASSDSTPNITEELPQSPSPQPPVEEDVPVYTYRDPMCNPRCRPVCKVDTTNRGGKMSLKLVDHTFTGYGPDKMKCPKAPFQFQGEASRNDRRYVLPEARMKLSLEGLQNPWYTRSFQGTNRPAAVYMDNRRCTQQPEVFPNRCRSESAAACQTAVSIPENYPCDVRTFRSLRSVTRPSFREFKSSQLSLTQTFSYTKQNSPNVKQSWTEADVVRDNQSNNFND